MNNLTRSAGRYLSKLSNKIRRQLDSFSFKGAFSGAQGKVLHFLLAQNEDVFQKDIEEEYSLRPSTATELLKQMEKSGLITREAVPYDKRLKKIILTEKAISYKEQVIKDLTDLEEKITKDIPKEDLETCFNVLEKMLDNLSE